jgi:hypothetical protein
MIENTWQEGSPMYYCTVTVIREGVVYNTQLFTGGDKSKVVKKAERAFAKIAEELTDRRLLDTDELKEALDDGYFQTRHATVCITWPEVNPRLNVITGDNRW